MYGNHEVCKLKSCSPRYCSFLSRGHSIVILEKVSCGSEGNQSCTTNFPDKFITNLTTCATTFGLTEVSLQAIHAVTQNQSLSLSTPSQE